MKKIINFLLITLVCMCTNLFAWESPNIGDLQVFPEDNPWNWDISTYDVHPNSDNFIANSGAGYHLHPDFGMVWAGAPNGIPYITVNDGEPLIPIYYTAFGEESDPGPFPIPLDAVIEGGSDGEGDRHVIAVDLDNAMLYELYRAFPGEILWEAQSGAQFDLTSNAIRPEGWTSADAAGLPIFPGLVRYEEVYIDQEIDHALRFTVEHTQRAYIWPARHYASQSDNPNLPPMGLRFRLKADFDITPFSEPVQVILTALKKYGMFVADNGSNMYISGAPDERWDDEVLSELGAIDGSNFEAILTVDSNGDPIYPPENAVNIQDSQTIDFRIANYPNPFNASTVIKYWIPEAGDVQLYVYNLAGQEIASLYDGYQQAGDHEFTWIPTGLTSGLYIYVLQTGNFAETGKLVYQK